MLEAVLGTKDVGRRVIYHGYQGNDMRTVALVYDYQLGCARHQVLVGMKPFISVCLDMTPGNGIPGSFVYFEYHANNKIITRDRNISTTNNNGGKHHEIDH